MTTLQWTITLKKTNSPSIPQETSSASSSAAKDRNCDSLCGAHSTNTHMFKCWWFWSLVDLVWPTTVAVTLWLWQFCHDRQTLFYSSPTKPCTPTALPTTSMINPEREDEEQEMWYNYLWLSTSQILILWTLTSCTFLHLTNILYIEKQLPCWDQRIYEYVNANVGVS